MLPFPLDDADRSQPSPERHGGDHRGRERFPGASGRLPEQAATIAEVLEDNGFSTFWIGKDHNVPEQDVASGASRKYWPLGMGFDRFYGFIGGETNQWYPDLIEDNHFIEAPYSPEQGYHLSKDLADHAIEMLRDQQASNPSRPWFMWFNPGANHGRTMRRRTISTGTRVSSTTAMRRTGPGCSPG